MIVAVAAKDEESVTRVKAGEYAIVRLDEGKPLYGWPKLGELFGSKVTRSIADWLGLAKPSLEEGAVARSFDDLAAEARALTDKSPPEATLTLIREIRISKLDPVSAGKLFKFVSSGTGALLSDLKAAWRTASKIGMGTKDLPTRVADETLDRHYLSGQHIVRSEKMFWRYREGYWQRAGEEQILKRLIDIAEKIVDPSEAHSGAVADQALRLLKGKLAEDDDPLRLTKEPRPIINVRNGELWLDDEGVPNLRPHSPNSYLTHRLDVSYDPTAVCPRYDNAVLEIFARCSNPEDMARHFNEFFGYAIQPVRDIPAYFIMRGLGANGKTSLLETVKQLMGPTAVLSDRIGTLEHSPFSIAKLAGRLLLLDDDVSTGTKLPDGLLKKISERKPMTGEYKYGGTFEFVSVVLPVMLCNNFPNLSDLSPGMRRRAHVIPFQRMFAAKEQDRSLFPSIWRNELSGVLNRALEGLQRLRKRGHFAGPEECEQALNQWLAHGNPLVAFIQERCELIPGHHTRLDHFYRVFRNWATEGGISSIPPRNTLSRNLENLAFPTRVVRGYREVNGLSIRSISTSLPTTTGPISHEPPAS